MSFWNCAPLPRWQKPREWLESDLARYRREYRASVLAMGERSCMFWHHARQAERLRFLMVDTRRTLAARGKA